MNIGKSKIAGELIAVQGKPVDIGGYYQPNLALVSAAMRPSATFNHILAGLSQVQHPAA
jgi:isocitrate dehydrogenase